MKRKIFVSLLVLMMFLSVHALNVYADDSASRASSNENVKTLTELTEEKECLISLIELVKGTIVYEYETAIEKCEAEVDAYCDKIDDQIDDLEWDLIGKPYSSTSQFNSLYSSYNNEIMTIQRKISALAGDNSSSARSQRARLQAQLKDVEAKRDELLEYRSIENTISALKNEKKSYAEIKEVEISAYQKLLQDEGAIESKACELIDNTEEKELLERITIAVNETSIKIDGTRIFEDDAVALFGLGMNVKRTYNKTVKECLEYLTYKIDNHEVEGHVETIVLEKAGISKNGQQRTYCMVCGELLETKTIYKASNVKLKTTEYAYNGKVKTPAVVVKDSKGNTISSKNYTLTKAMGRKNVGKYSYKITFKNQYKGTKTLYFTINPKSTSVKSLTKAKKAFTVKWSKVSSQATGYEIMYATNSKFTKGKKTVKVTSYKTTSKKITKLSAKKTYYVKIRTYKTVDGKKYYSDWSKTKSVKTN